MMTSRDLAGALEPDLSIAHRDMVAARLSPSGLANRYGAIPFAFPAAIELGDLGALSDALVCRRRRDKYAEKKLLLTGSKADVDSYLGKWRKTAVNRVCEAFDLVKEAEMERFGEKSSTVRPTACRLRILTTTLILLGTMCTLTDSKNPRKRSASWKKRK